MEFFSMVKTQFNSTIKSFQSDNAKELALINFLVAQGTLHQYSYVERPEQNSVVKRKHQHLLNVAHALYFQLCVPIGFWGNCLSTTTFIINRTPTPNLSNGVSSYELLFNKVPDYSSMRSFGCLCFASSLPSKKTKFIARAIPSIFVGYPLVIRHTNCITCKQDCSSSRRMSFFMSLLTHFMLCLSPNQF